MIERIHLEIVLKVSQLGSLTAAAEALFLTQSALSHCMSKLERQLGVALWQREGRQLRLTQAGQYLLGVAQRLLPPLSVAEARLLEFAAGRRGSLRIGMECHPCFQWLRRVLGPYLTAWPDVDVDVKQKFQFGGIGALLSQEIDLLVTPDPVYKPGLVFEPVFDYEQVLVVGAAHPLAVQPLVEPHQLLDETLLTYPVPRERLDVFTQFLLPAGITPRAHKTLEATEILLQLVAAGRAVSAMPRWLVAVYAESLPLVPLRLGVRGVAKQIFLGLRTPDAELEYLQAFVSLARQFAPEAL
jgi:LysR family transcriptional regulator, regulator for metE and metH